jgi:hypothetical protein
LGTVLLQQCYFVENRSFILWGPGGLFWALFYQSMIGGLFFRNGRSILGTVLLVYDDMIVYFQNWSTYFGHCFIAVVL